MMKPIPHLAFAAILLLTTPAPASDQTQPAGAAPQAGRAEQDVAIPAGEATAAKALESSPRHGEYVDVPAPGGGKPIRTWISYPETKDKAPVVIVIHEIFGLTDWIRAVADRLAADGFIALAPDLLSGKGPGGGGTEATTTRDEVVALVRSLTREEALARLNAVRDHGLALPAASGRSASIGFCWGGSTSFAWAAAQPGLDAAVVYYGGPPDAAALETVKAPVLGLYGGDDARVTSTVPDTEAAMMKAGKVYETHTYDGAGHGFLRQQDGKEGANLKASQAAWPETLAFLREHTR